jgi:hypothetical protein
MLVEKLVEPRSLLRVHRSAACILKTPYLSVTFPYAKHEPLFTKVVSSHHFEVEKFHENLSRRGCFRYLDECSPSRASRAVLSSTRRQDMSKDQNPTRTEPGEVMTTPEAETRPPSSIESAVATPTTTSLACYFRKSGSETWYWGLDNSDQYYKLNGEWRPTPYTKIQKFFTQTTKSEIVARAERAKTYYNLEGYELVGIFAADSAVGSNYPIVVNDGEELYPAG